MNDRVLTQAHVDARHADLDMAHQQAQLEPLPPLTYLYRPLGPRDAYASPAVPLQLCDTGGKPGPQIRWGTLDSGASTTVFPADVMDELGITPDMCIQVGEGREMADGTITEPAWTYPDGVEAVVAGYRVRLNGSFRQGGRILLGQEDFMAVFKVHFDNRAYTFQLEPYPDAERVG